MNRKHDTDHRERCWVLVQANQAILHRISDHQLPFHLLQVLVLLNAVDKKREFLTIFIFSIEMLESQFKRRLDENQLSEVDVIRVHEPVDLFEVDCPFEIFLPIFNDPFLINFCNVLFITGGQVIHRLLNHPRDGLA
jgi:hypothetical protein